MVTQLPSSAKGVSPKMGSTVLNESKESNEKVPLNQPQGQPISQGQPMPQGPKTAPSPETSASPETGQQQETSASPESAGYPINPQSQIDAMHQKKRRQGARADGSKETLLGKGVKKAKRDMVRTLSEVAFGPFALAYFAVKDGIGGMRNILFGKPKA